MAETVSMADGDILQGSNQRQEYGPQTEFAWRLLAACIGWVLLGFACSFVIGILIGLVAPMLHMQSIPRAIVAAYAGAFGFGGVLLPAAIIRGRIVGSGNIGAGLGNEPMQRLPLIISLAVIVALYAVFLHIALTGAKFDGTSRNLPSVSFWTTSVGILCFGVIVPLAEESLWRGWLWTGLEKHWGVLPTALLTSTLWVAGHGGIDVIRPLSLMPLATILAAARYFGRSVRAPLALHMIYNLAVMGAPWLLKV